jgi:hypothetical protein
VFLCYFQWPPQEAIGVIFNSAGEVTYAVDKSAFFYAVNAFMIAYNLIFILLNATAGKVPAQFLAISNKDFWTLDKNNAAYLKAMISNWITSLAAMLNLIFILWLIMVTYANLDQFDMRRPLSNFSFLAPLLFGTIVLWTGFALFRLKYKSILIKENKIN